MTPHPSYLLLEGPLQGLHLHLLLAEPRVQRRALGLGSRSNLSDLLVGSVVGGGAEHTACHRHGARARGPTLVAQDESADSPQRGDSNQ